MVTIGGHIVVILTGRNGINETFSRREEVGLEGGNIFLTGRDGNFRRGLFYWRERTAILQRDAHLGQIV